METVSNKGTYFEWLYLLVARGLQWMVLDFVLPFCNLPHLHVYLQKKKKEEKTIISMFAWSQ